MDFYLILYAILYDTRKEENVVVSLAIFAGKQENVVRLPGSLPKVYLVSFYAVISDVVIITCE